MRKVSIIDLIPSLSGFYPKSLVASSSKVKIMVDVVVKANSKRKFCKGFGQWIRKMLWRDPGKLKVLVLLGSYPRFELSVLRSAIGNMGECG